MKETSKNEPADRIVIRPETIAAVLDSVIKDMYQNGTESKKGLQRISNEENYRRHRTSKTFYHRY